MGVHRLAPQTGTSTVRADVLPVQTKKGADLSIRAAKHIPQPQPQAATAFFSVGTEAIVFNTWEAIW